MDNREEIPRLTREAEGANLARRNQMKLSGKRTLSPNELWKVRSTPSWTTPTVKV
jgi:hypothetical protein